MSRTLLVGLCVYGVLMGASTGGAEPLTTPELLVDLARDHGLNQRGKQSAADVQLVRALLRSATRLDPKLASAYVWLYELATLEGDTEEAGRMLGGLLEADPTHQDAFARWLAAGLTVRHTIEERTEWLAAVGASRRTPAQMSMVHVALARQAMEQLDVERARGELRQALELEPASVEAAALMVEALGSGATDAERLGAALGLLRVAPNSVTSAADVALILDHHGLVEEAAEFYEHAAAVSGQMGQAGALPGRTLLAWARNLEARGLAAEAAEQARRAAEADPGVAAEAGIFLYFLLESQSSGAGESVRTQLAQRFATIREPSEWPVNEVAQAAWFYCTVELQPDRALMLARSACERAGQPFTVRVLGWAEAANGVATAGETLSGVAAHDPYAAYALAKLLVDSGDSAGARRVVAELSPKPVAGRAYELLNALGSGMAAGTAASQPTSEATSQPTTREAVASDPEMMRVLGEFDRRVFDFAREPERFLEATVEMEDRSVRPGEPWWCVFKLKNRGPLAITLGPDGMVNPVFLLSFEVEGDRKREYPALLTVNIDRVRVLHPGESVETRQTLDVGPLRRVARQSPQQSQRVVMRVLLDAVAAPDGTWQVAPGGQRLRPVYFNRVPAGTGRESMNAMFGALGGERVGMRWQAIELMAELLGEQQRAALGRLEYKPAAVPTERIQAQLLNLLGSESWETRVRTLEALQVTGLDRGTVGAVEACLDHSYWPVRLMAVRLLARQGAGFAERAEAIARDDADEQVRAVAASYVAKWKR